MTEPTAPAAAPNRLPLILGVGAGVLLLIFLLSQVLGGGDDGTDTEVTPAPTAPPQVVAPTTVPGAAPPAETFETFNTKNPFVPLRILSTGGGGGGGAAAPPAGGGTAPATPGGTTAVGGTAGTGTTATGPAGGTSGTGATGGTGAGSAGGTTEPRRGARVALLDVFASGGKVVANVRVNDTVHKVGEGEAFATNFKVISLSQADGCGRFLFGDDAFRLCKGEESLK